MPFINKRAPNGSHITLREFALGDWRWVPPRGEKRLRMRSRVTTGMPVEMRSAVEDVKARTGLPMAEVVRRCLAASGLPEEVVARGTRGRDR